MSEYLKFLLNKQPCNQIYPFVTNIYRFLSTFWKLTVLFFFFVVGNLMVSIGTCKHGIFPIRRKLECAISSFQRFPQFFFPRSPNESSKPLSDLFFFFKLSRQGFCIFACFLLSLLGVAHNFVHLNVLEGFSVLG